MYMPSSLPDDNAQHNLRWFLLDPLSTIIKLAILGNKPVGTKISIQNNTIDFQEPGPFQSVCRIVFHSNKTDIQYLYNPIHLACTQFLSKDGTKKFPRIKNLFVSAQKGLEKLMDTYKNSAILRLCLNYYYSLIANHVDEHFNDGLFRRDNMSAFYNEPLTRELAEKWTQERLKIVLDLIGFLNHDVLLAESNVRSLENIMLNIDVGTRECIQ